MLAPTESTFNTGRVKKRVNKKGWQGRQLEEHQGRIYKLECLVNVKLHMFLSEWTPFTVYTTLSNYKGDAEMYNH